MKLIVNISLLLLIIASVTGCSKDEPKPTFTQEKAKQIQSRANEAWKEIKIKE
jgi:hypothetical protein